MAKFLFFFLFPIFGWSNETLDIKLSCQANFYWQYSYESFVIEIPWATEIKFYEFKKHNKVKVNKLTIKGRTPAVAEYELDEKGKFVEGSMYYPDSGFAEIFNYDEIYEAKLREIVISSNNCEGDCITEVINRKTLETNQKRTCRIIENNNYLEELEIIKNKTNTFLENERDKILKNIQLENQI